MITEITCKTCGKNFYGVLGNHNTCTNCTGKEVQ